MFRLYEILLLFLTHKLNADYANEHSLHVYAINTQNLGHEFRT